MASCGILLKVAVMCAVLVTLVNISSAAPEKLDSCCKKVSSQEITDPILGYLVQRRNLPCVAAVIFQTEKGMFCSQVKAPWVHRKIREFEMARRRATASPPPSTVASATPSLLSILTSTMPPSSSPTASSSPSSSPTVSSSPTSSSSQ